MLIDKTIKANQTSNVKPDFQKCACESCTIAGQFASPGWLCEFHRDTPPQYWRAISEAYKPYKKLYAIRNRLISDKGYGDSFDLFQDRESAKLSKELSTLGCCPPELHPDFQESSYHFSQRIFNYLYDRIVLETLREWVLQPPLFEPTPSEDTLPAIDLCKKEEPYVYEDAPF